MNGLLIQGTNSNGSIGNGGPTTPPYNRKRETDLLVFKWIRNEIWWCDVKRRINENLKSDIYYKTEWNNRLENSFDAIICKLAAEIHSKIELIFINKDFIEQNGLYMINRECLWYWLKKWFEIQNQLNLDDSLNEFLEFGSIFYSIKH